MINQEILDICIVGGGLSGLYLTRQLRDSNLRIAVLERGSDQIRHPNKDALIFPHESLRIKRESLNFGVGGNLRTWDGWLTRIPETDFELREWISNDEWPIPYRTMAKFYKRVEKELLDATEIEEFDSRMESVNLVVRQLCQISNLTNFTRTLLSTFAHSNNLQIMTNTKVEKITIHERGNFEIHVIKNKNPEIIRARKVVIATNTLEAVRLVHNSKIINNANVGKYFMEHPKGTIATLSSSVFEKLVPQEIKRTLLGRQGGVLKGFHLDFEIQKKYHLPNHYFRIESLQSGLGRHFRKHGMEVDDLAIRIFTEMPPSLENKIEIFDNDGYSPISVTCEITDGFLDSVEIFRREILEKMQVQNFANLETLNSELFRDSSHHMGGLRMSNNRLTGVVDENLEFYGIENLFALGSCVFPISSSINPTLTLMALALRLSELLKGEG